jgi:hypothetical protein
MTTTITQVKYADLGGLINQVFHDIKTIAIKIMVLQLHLFLALKVLKGKHQDMIATRIVGLEHPNLDPLFPFAPSDNTLRRDRRILEPHVQKKNHLKDKTTKHMHI